jgi:hypothetical protein
MDPLYQQLKELDSNTFELLCFHLLKLATPESTLSTSKAREATRA